MTGCCARSTVPGLGLGGFREDALDRIARGEVIGAGTWAGGEPATERSSERRSVHWRAGGPFGWWPVPGPTGYAVPDRRPDRHAAQRGSSSLPSSPLRPVRRSLAGFPRSPSSTLRLAVRSRPLGTRRVRCTGLRPSPPGRRPCPGRPRSGASGPSAVGGRRTAASAAAWRASSGRRRPDASDAGALPRLRDGGACRVGEVAVALRFAATGGEAALALLAQRVRASPTATVPPSTPICRSAALRSWRRSPASTAAQPIIRPVPTRHGRASAPSARASRSTTPPIGRRPASSAPGVKVGIIDGGFIGLSSRLGRELPSSVHARCYREVGLYSSTVRSCEAFTEHGTAVAETIADMAPGASLYLADPVSLQDLESTVAWMTSNGVKIINVSLGFAYEGPGDGNVPADSVYSVVDQAVKGGALWVNAAGNAGEDGWAGTVEGREPQRPPRVLRRRREQLDRARVGDDASSSRCAGTRRGARRRTTTTSMSTDPARRTPVAASEDTAGRRRRSGREPQLHARDVGHVPDRRDARRRARSRRACSCSC